MFATTIDSTERQDATEVLVARPKPAIREAFGRLIEQYQRAVYATVYRHLGNDAEAQEVCQEMFLQRLAEDRAICARPAASAAGCAIAGRMAINRAVRRQALASTSTSIEAVCARQYRTPLGRCWPGERGNQVQPRPAATLGPGPRDPGRVLLRRPVAAGDERSVPDPAGHDQAPAARRPEAAGQGIGGPGPGVTAGGV